MIKEFYAQNKNELLKNYPGLTLKRLENEHDDYKSFHSNGDLIFIEKLNQGIPLEYINNNAYFFTSNFFVNENVLIPRNETEILVEDVLNEIKTMDKNEIKLAEIGIGSGAIFLSILENTNKQLNITGTDISSDAIEVANMNVFRKKNKISKSSNLSIIQTDRLEGISGNFDIVISNPPYIKESQKNLVHQQVLKHEPDIALFLKDDDYEQWFRDFFKEIDDHLVVGGKAFIEGHEDLIEDLAIIAKEYFKQITIKNDYTDVNRFIYLEK